MPSSVRLWIFRILVLAATALVLVSWFMPWWSLDVEAISIKNAVVIHPWALDNNLGGYAYYLDVDMMPAFFEPFMWVVLVFAVVVLLSSLFVKDKSVKLLGRQFNLPGLMIGFIGIGYIIVVLAALIVIFIRTREMAGDSFVLQGQSFMSMGGFEESYVDTRFGFGYWLACAMGPVLIVLALLRNKIIGQRN
jgi:hypothetical protein